MQDASADQHSRDKPAKYILHPNESMPYAWDYPAAREKKIVIAIGTAQRSIDIMEIGNLIPFKFSVSVSIHFGNFMFQIACSSTRKPEQSLLTFGQIKKSKYCVSPTTTPSKAFTNPVKEVTP